MLETQPGRNYVATNALLAKYIWDRYRDYLDCFAIGNEPDHKRVYSHDLTITNFDAYLERWRRAAAAITRAVPAKRPPAHSSERIRLIRPGGHQCHGFT